MSEIPTKLPLTRETLVDLMDCMCMEGFPLSREKRQHFVDILDNDPAAITMAWPPQRTRAQTAELAFAWRMLLLDDCWHAITMLRRKARARQARGVRAA
jgi:hypothetical protein